MFLIIRERKGKHDKKETEFFSDGTDLHTPFGTIPKEAFQQGRYRLGKERFTILPAHFMDRYVRLRRGAQVIQQKDLGVIIATTGLSRQDVVLDIGAGSGFSALLLGRIARHVYTYDVNEEHLAITKKNLAEMGVENVTVEKGDAYRPETIPHEEEIDLFLLDVPEPWKAVSTAEKVLRRGSFLVAYTPCITQAMRVVEALKNRFLHVRTVEVLEREWRVAGEAVRPESKDFQHTAFLTFCRRV